MKEAMKILASLFALSLCSLPAFASTDHYLSSAGKDSNPGTMKKPWKSLNAIYSHGPYGPGDRLLLRGGDTFPGIIYLDNTKATTSSLNPVIISSYGNGRATINAGNGTGIYVYNLAGINITNLNVVGSGAGFNAGKGIIFYNQLPNTVLDHITIDNVDVSGFSGPPNGRDRPAGGNGLGIAVAPGSDTSGYRHVNITNAKVHDNSMVGLLISPWYTTKLISDVHIAYVEAYNNQGISGIDPHSGDGVNLGGIILGTFEYSKTYNNGGLSTSTNEGPCGFMMYLSDQITVQYNESYSNKSSPGADGCGFDIDGGTTNSVAQNNASHDNDGAGFLINWYPGVGKTENNIVRYNSTRNDGKNQRATESPITLHTEVVGNLSSNSIYGNDVYNDLGSTYSSGIFAWGAGTNTIIRNNTITTTKGKALLRIEHGQSGLTIQGNIYKPVDGPFLIVYNGVSYSSLEAFRVGTGQENQ